MGAYLFAILTICSLACFAADTEAGNVTAEQIMAKVAQNQDKAVKQREAYVYEQKVRVISRRTSGKVMGEETSIYQVTPSEKGTKQELKSMEGRYWKKGKYIAVRKQGGKRDDKGKGESYRGDNGEEDEGHGIDGGIVHLFEEGLTDTDSKDGFGKDLFPLTSEKQENLQFRLDGERTVKGRPAYVISFGPKNSKEFTWAGEAWVDKCEFQPVHVATKLSRKLPMVVRTMLGTDVPGLGFNVEYSRFDQDVWFPVSFGTEFRVRAVFFFSRDVTAALENSGFAKTQVESSIQYEPVK